MTTGFDDNVDERAEIEWQSYQRDLAVEAAVKAERERIISDIEGIIAELPKLLLGDGRVTHLDVLCSTLARLRGETNG